MTDKDESKPTITKLPWWKFLLVIAGILVWVWAAIVAAQFVIGYLMLFILGPDKFIQPIWSAIYSALSYLIAMILIIWLPYGVITARKNDKHKMSKR